MSQSSGRPEVAIGQLNTLEVVRQRDVGAFLDGGQFGSILLPRRYVPDGCQDGDKLEVFVHLDSEDDLIATTDTPKVMVGQIACLEVVATGAIGAFLDWGLPKDLLLPFGEQRHPAEEGERYLVRAYLDNTNRIAASTKLDKYLDQPQVSFRRHQKVQLLIAERTPLGCKAVIDQVAWGLIHTQDLFRDLKYGQSISGFIKQVRADGKIDLLLEEPGYSPVTGLAAQVIEQLKQNEGFLPLNDRSSADQIQARFGVSKKKFKMAIGSLYKQRLIELQEDGIRLLATN